jgi:DNA-binding CsgD family transcriptional regulator
MTAGAMPTPAAPPPQPALLERAAEIATIQDLVVAARAGAGRLLVVEGRAGMGKTRLLSEARRTGEASGFEVLAARAGQLEQGFAFGVVRQLFEPLLARAAVDERTGMLAGAAGLALPLFEELSPPLSSEEPVGGSFAMLHGLYWLAANLALRRPTLLVIDDLHWADGPSLQWIAFLARRLEGLPLLVVVATRPPDQSPLADALIQVLSDPEAVTLRPEPLTTAAVAELARTALAATPDPAFVAACANASGGNPLFLRALLDTVAREGIRPTAGNAARVGDIGPETMARSISVQLARLPIEATTLAHAAAVLGDGIRLHQVAALAGLEVEAAARAATNLVRSGLLRREDPVEFIHPVVRSTLYQRLAADERTGAHRRAGESLLTAGAPAEQAAAHLLQTLPAGDPFVSTTLRRAAERSLTRGAPQAAVGYLHRALEEPPPDEERAELLHMLGTAELGSANPTAIEHLYTAFSSVEDPVRRGQFAMACALALALAGRFDAASEVLGQAIGGLGQDRPELRELLEAAFLNFATLDAETHADADQRIASIREDTLHGGLGAAMLRAVMANYEARVGSDRERCISLAARVLEDGLLRHSRGLFFGLQAVLVLTIADETETASRFFEEALTEAGRRGDLLSVHHLRLFRGFLAGRRGDLLEAEDDLRAVELDPVARTTFRPGYLAEILVERGEVAEAERTIELVRPDEETPEVLRLPYIYARARVDLHAGRLEQAHAGFQAVGDLMEAVGNRNPAFYPWRSQAALLLQRVGDDTQAFRLAEEELGLARRWGAARTIGVALRAFGLVQSGRAGERVLQGAVDTLRRSSARLEYARALVDLGAALRRRNQRVQARQLLREGLELAYRAGATPLLQQAKDELAATGARPRNIVRTGVAALTASERRVARMAAQGMSNKELAQALFVTVKAVEVHLSSAYRKLQISSRGELAEALAGSQDAPGASMAP